MAKLKQCSFCNKEVEKLWFSNPKCCMDFSCKKQYAEQKGKPKQKPIAPFSNKKLTELAEYRPLRDKYLKEHPICEARIEGVCQGQPVQLHHKASRKYHLCNMDIFMSVCNECHREIHDSKTQEPYEKGFLIKSI